MTDVPLEEIPRTVDDEAGGELLNFLVPICALSPRESDADFRLIGSGTLVEISGRHHILTAAHVWDATRHADRIGLVLTTRHPSRFAMPRDTVTPRVLSGRGSLECWGPDLALLEIAPVCVGVIRAHRSFLNLARQRESLGAQPPAIEKGYWAITGMVEELSDVRSDSSSGIITANIEARAFFGGIRYSYEREGLDYLDFGAKPHLAGLRRSFGGMSGGGLWEIGLSRATDGVIRWSRHFRGVAFWEERESDDRMLVRCHGPQSVFDRAWTEWALPPSP